MWFEFSNLVGANALLEYKKNALFNSVYRLSLENLQEDTILS